jgi:pantoate--beta-alanine ligase
VRGPRLVRDTGALAAALTPARQAGTPVALVPTMGALHEGHLSLVRAAREHAPLTAVSIFVNPLQFGPSEDFESYPRDLDRDLELLAGVGADLVFAPDASAFTPQTARTVVHVPGITGRLEGASRPGHFDGVTTIVAKLLHAVRPDVALFGEKDFQQLVVIRTMVTDLGFGVEVVGCPVVREPDGLALSSRNAYLSAQERQDAVGLSRALHAVARAWDGDADRAREDLRTRLAGAPGIRPDYAEVVDPGTLEPLVGVTTGPARAVVAAFVGSTRLIDTLALSR